MIPVFVEALRRIIAVGCLFIGIWMIVQPGGILIVARVVDFEQEFSHSPYPSARTGTLADFIRRRTEGRVLEATGTPWAAFATAMRDGSAAGYLQRLSSSVGGEALVYRTGQLPESPHAWVHPVSYLHLPAEDLWISLSPEHAPTIAGLDRRWAHPKRAAGLWLVPLAFLAYALLPHRKLPPDALVYSRIPSVILPDMLGALGGAFFFILPILIVTENAPGQAPWSPEGGWAWLTGILWSMAAGFLLLHVIAFSYATLQLTVTEPALVITRGLRSHAYAWSEMESCTPYASSRGRILGLLLMIFGRSPALVGQSLLVASNTERGLEIRMTDGRTVRLMANAFPGYATVIAALAGHGIPGASVLPA